MPEPQEPTAAALTREQHNSLQAALFDSPETVESFMDPLLTLDASSRKARMSKSPLQASSIALLGALQHHDTSLSYAIVG